SPSLCSPPPPLCSPLSLHDALPIFRARRYDLVILVDYPGYHLRVAAEAAAAGIPVLYYIAPQMWAWAPGRVRKLAAVRRLAVILDRKSTRLNSSHQIISYAVFCLKK